MKKNKKENKSKENVQSVYASYKDVYNKLNTTSKDLFKTPENKKAEKVKKEDNKPTSNILEHFNHVNQFLWKNDQEEKRKFNTSTFFNNNSSSSSDLFSGINLTNFQNKSQHTNGPIYNSPYPSYVPSSFADSYENSNLQLTLTIKPKKVKPLMFKTSEITDLFDTNENNIDPMPISSPTIPTGDLLLNTQELVQRSRQKDQITPTHIDEKILLQQLQDVFEVQYKTIYFDLIKVIKALFSSWAYQFNNEDQKRFYAILYIFNQFCYCFNEEKSVYSKDCAKFLNFYYFWCFDFNYCIWSAFSYRITTTTSEQLLTLWQALREITSRLALITQKNLPNLYKWTIQYQQLNHSLNPLFTLNWGIKDFNYLTFPYRVLDEFILENQSFIQYYFSLEHLKKEVVVLNSETLKVYNYLYKDYLTLNKNSYFDLKANENMKSLLIKDMMKNPD